MVAQPAPQLALDLDGAALRDQAISLLERTRREYIAEARDVADYLSTSRESFTADDVTRLCPVPAGMDGRVMGAVLTTRRYKKLGSTSSTRVGRHACPIAVWGAKS